MQKILMVGESDLLIENIYDYLTKMYKIQICDASDTAIVRMHKIIKPNLILVVKTSGISDDLITSIKGKILETPIVCICGEGDIVARKNSVNNMHFMFRPIKNEDLYNKIKELIGEDLNEKTPESYDGLFVKKDKHQILAIDDNPMVLRGLKQLLDVEYDVTLATSVNAAKKHIENKKFELILLDYEMPEIDGFEAYKLYKSDPVTKDIPVVFLTGVSDKNRISEVVSLNPKPAGYLLKPIDADILKETISKLFK